MSSDDTPDDRIAPGLTAEAAADFLNSFLTGIPGSVYFKDNGSRFTAVSLSKARRHGMKPDEMVGKSDEDFFTSENAQWRRADEVGVMQTGRPIVARVERVAWKNGYEGLAQTTKMPLRDDSGAVIGTFGISHDVTEQQRVADELEKTRRDLIEASRLAGMAEVATGVLHNVGNVLTSLNVSANVLSSGLRYSKAESLGKVAALLQEHSADLGNFVTRDPKGRRIPEFLRSLSEHMVGERERLLNELTALQQNIDHIKEIITMQQAYATTAGTVESLDPAALVEDSLRMNAGALLRHSVSVVRDFHPTPPIRAERAKVLQILVNLVRNAKYAVDDSGQVEKIITVTIAPAGPARVQIRVHDNGIGIPAANMSRLFQHGFTTRAKGHGFGLHSALQAASELKGTLTAHSDGIGTGATFTLELPADDSSAVRS